MQHTKCKMQIITSYEKFAYRRMRRLVINTKIPVSIKYMIRINVFSCKTVRNLECPYNINGIV